MSFKREEVAAVRTAFGFVAERVWAEFVLAAVVLLVGRRDRALSSTFVEVARSLNWPVQAE